MFSLQTLSNGTRVILAPRHETQSVTVEALFPVGSRHETLALNGASHFLEHMLFKGTKRRPTALHISRALDGVGAEYNAFTGKDYTGYYVKANAEHLDLALDVVADMCFAPTLALEEVARERNVILEEIHMYEDDPRRHLDDLFEELLYRGHPLARYISGTQQTVTAISRAMLVAHHRRHYDPARCVLTVAGNMGDHAMGGIERTFGAVRARREHAPVAPRYTKHPRGPVARVHHKETSQNHLALGVPTFGGDDPRQEPLALLANILGGTMSSRLFVAVRERRGLAYSVHASVDAYADAGSLTVSAGLDKTRLDEALRVIVRELARIRTRGVTAAELARAKENLEGRIILGLEESSTLADWYGKQALLRKTIRTPEEKINRLMAVTGADVGAVAREVLRTDRLHLMIIGPFADSDAKRFQGMLQL